MVPPGPVTKGLPPPRACPSAAFVFTGLAALPRQAAALSILI